MVSDAHEWRWHKVPETWSETEALAADHMRHLGFQHVIVTPPGRDGGLDVVALGAAAQVKDHTAPTGSPAIQALIGAAFRYPQRLFYAKAFTASAIATADQLDVALFVVDPYGSVAPANPAALTLMPVKPTPAKWYEVMSFDERARRCVRWTQEITQHSETAKISNWNRRATKQLKDRVSAMQAVDQALGLLADLSNPTHKKRRQKRSLAEAEELLRAAAKSIGLTLK